jgi:hypothetical protein
MEMKYWGMCEYDWSALNNITYENMYVVEKSQEPVAHAYNPNYSAGRDQEDWSLSASLFKVSPGKQFVRP